MKANQLINKRFEELAQKGTTITVTSKQREFPQVFAVAGPQRGAESSSPRSTYTAHIVDRQEFITWGTSSLNLLQRIFGDTSIHYTQFRTYFDEFKGDTPTLNACMAVFNAAREDYEGGYLFNVETLVSAEVLDDVLEQAEALLSSGYRGPAGVTVGVALETTLKKLCDREGIPHAKLDRMNADLAKKGLYNVGMQKQITAWADLRNRAAHGQWEQFTAADVEDMIRGVRRFIADHL